MIDDFILRALAGALILAAMLGPLGCFVVWRRMAYFGDTIAHASLLGVALSLLVGEALPMGLAVMLVAVTVALALTRMTRDARLQSDTVLGILAHSLLALGLVLVALNRDVRVDVNAYLFGDVLTMDNTQLALLAAVAIVVIAVLLKRWRRLLMATIHPAIAEVEGVDARREQLILTLLLAGVIAISIKITGILLITALLVIPAAAARFFASTPQQMAAFASLLGMLSVGGGLYSSMALDLPTGPMMVVAAAGVFIASSFFRRAR